MLMILSLCACDKEPASVYEPKTYELNADYIGNNFKSSENVTGISVYENVSQYNESKSKNDIVWIEYTAADSDYIKTLINEKKTVIVLSENDRGSLMQELTGIAPRDSVEDGLCFIGLLFTDITESGNDVVNLYCTDNKESQTEFLAFCTLYEYSEKYQGTNMVTDIQATEVLKDSFNGFNLAGQAYSVIMATLVDFLDNPTKTGDNYEFEYTVLSFADVVSAGGKFSGFDMSIEAGSDGWTLKTCPEADIEFAEGTDMRRNFLFMRLFNASFDVERKGIIKPLIKGFGTDEMTWRIAALDKNDKEIGIFASQNMTGAVDFMNTTGRYKPACKVLLTTDYEGSSFGWDYGVYIDEWAIVWGDDYEE